MKPWYNFMLHIKYKPRHNTRENYEKRVHRRVIVYINGCHFSKRVSFKQTLK